MKIKIISLTTLALVLGIIQSCKVQEGVTGAINYTKQVKPIIDLNCATTCHSAANHKGDIVLSSYEGVKHEALEGELLPAIRHEEGVDPMPRLAPKLDDESIAIIEAWVEKGAPE